MKLSGHSYSGDVFSSLLDNIKSDIVLLKQASKEKSAPISGTDVFHAVTAETLQGIQEDELKIIASELQFAADKAHVDINGQNLIEFANTVKKDNLRGKTLERAAQKYCNNINRASAQPVSATKMASLDNTGEHSVLSASFPADQMNNSKTGGFLGMSKNPNTIWDSSALHKMASVPDAKHEKFGDEQIKDSKEARQQYKDQEKDKEWQDLQEKLSDSMMLTKCVANVSTGQESGTTQKLPANSMSIFSNDRDFNNIPEKTAGEMLKDKPVVDKDNPRQLGALKADNSANSLFNKQVANSKNSVHRKSIDQLFDKLSNLKD